MLKIKFLGAAGTVTGSQFLVENEKARILVDAGLFQGSREWREKNRSKPAFDVRTLDAVLLTHAHVDHIGLLPRLCALGLHCPVYCTAPTLDLARIILYDSAELQKEEAVFRKKTRRSRHENPEALYSVQDVEEVLKLFQPVQFDECVRVTREATAHFTQMGHILGASSIALDLDGKRINFSGDVGRYGIPILKDPGRVDFGDLLLIESTYGNRTHPREDPLAELGAVVNRTAKRGGMLLIPSFSVGRVQLLLYYLRELKEKRLIPDIPVIVDSPMAADATSIYSKYPDCFDEEAQRVLRRGNGVFEPSKLYFTKDREESKKLNSIFEPMIVIAGNGMLSGGRVLHHLFHRLSSPENTVLFVGYQPSDGRGAWLLKGAPSIKIMAEEVAVRSEICEISGLSAHADKDELLQWCRESKSMPQKVVVTHGEPDAARDFSEILRREFGWDVVIVGYMGELSL